MIDVKIKNATGSITFDAKLYTESGLVSYPSNDKLIWEHVGSLVSKGWEISQEVAKEVTKEEAEKKPGKSKK